MTLLRPLRLALLLVTAVLATGAARAQFVVEPEIRVNARAVTAFEIDQRARLLAALGAGGDVRRTARDQLIDEALQSEVIERLELSLEPDELDQRIAAFAESRQLSRAELDAALARNGIAPVTLRDFVRNGTLWREAAQNIFRRQALPSDADLERAIALQQGEAAREVRLQELAVPFAERGEEATRALVLRLSRTLSGAGEFTAAVERYSEAPSAARGGRLDWIAVSDLPPPLAGQVLALQPGEVTAPVPVQGGLAVFRLLEVRRTGAAPRGAGGGPAYFELVVPLPADAGDDEVAAARARLAEVRQSTRTCQDLQAEAEAFGSDSGRRSAAAPAALPAALQRGEVGQIEIARDARGVVLWMLCRGNDGLSVEEREALRNRLFNQRMNALAEGFLQELRADAVIVGG